MKKITNKTKAFKDARKYAKQIDGYTEWYYNYCTDKTETLVGRIVTVSAKVSDSEAQVLLVTEANRNYEECYCLVNQDNIVIQKIPASADSIEMIEDIQLNLNLHLISDNRYEVEGEYQDGDFILECNTNQNFQDVQDDGFPDYD